MNLKQAGPTSKPKLSELPNDTHLICDNGDGLVFTAQELKDDINGYGRKAHEEIWSIANPVKWKPSAELMIELYIEQCMDYMYEDWDERAYDRIKHLNLQDKIQALLDECFNDDYATAYFEVGKTIEVDIFPPKTKIISAFPGCGKTHFHQLHPDYTLDSDSSAFSWTRNSQWEKIRDENFPNNYIEHITSNIGMYQYIFVSSHENVRRALEERKIEYTLVYPSLELKDEWIHRFKQRGDDQAFIDLISNYYVTFIEQMEQETFPEKVVLQPGQYLTDIITMKEADT